MDETRRAARFGPFAFDFGERVLRREGTPVPLQPQPTAVLAILLEEPGRLVSREELRDRVWRDRVVEFDNGLNFSVAQVRRALDDDARSPRFLETVHRRGYRFIHPVEYPVRKDGGAGARRSRGRVAAVLGLVAVGVVATYALAGPGSGPSEDAGPLPDPLGTTFRAASWLYEQGDYRRSLGRLDSVRLSRPDFADAWVLTARARLALGERASARRAAERALSLRPANAEAYDVLGRAHFLELMPEAALDAFRRAVELDGSEPTYRQWYAQTLANLLRFDEAIAQLELVRRQDPISNLVGVDLASVYLAAGRYRDALTFCANSLDLVPDASPWARDCLMTASYFLGDRDAALEHARALMLLEGASPEEAARVADVEAYFRWDLDRLEAARSRGGNASPFLLARATARLRDRGRTLEGIAALREGRHYGLQWVPRDVWFRFLHEDGELGAMLREAGLPVPGTS